MKHYRRCFALMLAGLLLLACAACGGGPMGDDPLTDSTATEIDALTTETLTALPSDPVQAATHETTQATTAGATRATTVKATQAPTAKTTVKPTTPTTTKTAQAPGAPQYVRTNGGYPYDEREKTVVIESKKQLDDYYRVNRIADEDDYKAGNFYFDDSRDGSKSFADAIAKYDDAYFNDHLLVLVVLVEPSGSYRHIVTSVDNNAINIKRITAGGVGTDDMAAWHIIVEISRADCSSHEFVLNIA